MWEEAERVAAADYLEATSSAGAWEGWGCLLRYSGHDPCGSLQL